VGGANTWGEITVDDKRGIAYFPTGSATYDFYGADRIGSNLFGDCLLALDARTGKRLWHYQTVHHDLWDYDGPNPVMLFDVKVGGRDGQRIRGTHHMHRLSVPSLRQCRPKWSRPQDKWSRPQIKGT